MFIMAFRLGLSGVYPNDYVLLEFTQLGERDSDCRVFEGVLLNPITADMWQREARAMHAPLCQTEQWPSNSSDQSASNAQQFIDINDDHVKTIDIPFRHHIPQGIKESQLGLHYVRWNY
ncbi:hypothetical protein G7Z17_g7907 [Cylindrodendrum hubeiense]|uniref:Uncharacterized protein n=1 Tax=Cylindrodendrum hubeiense TaxID=595255 RepID=A0A9P5LDQ3_9HYPO|nr:hypothetical protein G7Z17_g7907 [Cylindrodendrum hubeiense]